MNKSQAKKIAYRRAYKILQSTMACGWTPNEMRKSGYEYNDQDSDRILDAMDEIINQLRNRSTGNLEDKKTEDGETA